MKKLFRVGLAAAVCLLAVAASALAGPSWTFVWTDNSPPSDGVTGYNFYETTSGAPVLVATIPIASGQKYVLDGTNLARGTHSYVVTAFNPDGESAPSNTATIQKKIIPAAPTSLTATQN